MADALTKLPPDAENVSLGGFDRHAGPIYRLGADGDVRRFALPVEDRHMNGGGTVHGGLLMSFADVAMSETGRAVSGAPDCSVVSLTCDFVGPGRAGDILEARVRVTRQTRTLLFLCADIVAGARVVAVATGLWKIG